MAVCWSGVSSYRKLDSSSRCQRVSGGKAKPGVHACAARRGRAVPLPSGGWPGGSFRASASRRDRRDGGVAAAADRRPPGGAVPLELVEAVQRHVEPVAAFVLDDRHLEETAPDGDRLDAAVDPNAVIEMDHVVPGGQRAGGRRRRRLPVAPRPAQPPGAAEDLVVRQHPERGKHEPAVERADGERRACGPRCPSLSSSSRRSSWPSLSHKQQRRLAARQHRAQPR